MKHVRLVRRFAWVLGAALCYASSAAAQTEPPVAPAPPAGAPSSISMTPGEIKTMLVQDVQRAAVGDPTVVDVTVISTNELMLQAKRIGISTLLFWDRTGEHSTRVEVSEKTPDVIEGELASLLRELGLAGVRVRREKGLIFLMGEVGSAEDLGKVEMMLAGYKGQVINLVTLPPPVAPRPGIPPLISLAVQLIELNRTDLERLGVKWSDSLAATEIAETDRTFHDVLFAWGHSVNRSSLQATLSALVQKKRARLLAEPKLVTAHGKEASSFIGVEVPIIEATSVGTGAASVNASIKFRETGVLLKMTPYLLEEDEKIRTTLTAEVSSVDNSVGLSVPVGSQTILVPGFAVRKASTEMTTRSGETILIAGLLQAEDTTNIDQVPALGSMPVLGRLFRSPEVKTVERELVIAVTPELLAEKGEDSDRKLAVEQALASADVVSSVDDPRLRYALTIQDRIASNLRYPQREKEEGRGGTVKLKLHLSSDGALGRVMVSQSSGVEALDVEAVRAAESQAPYPPFPPQLAEKELWLELPVIFRP